MKMHHILTRTVAVLVILSVSCAAPAGPIPAQPTTARSTGVAATPTATPQKGGTLVAWSRVTPPTFDTHAVPNWVPVFTGQVFSQLLRFDPTQSQLTPNKIQPDLATTWEQGKDGLSYTFHLRQGVKWHDGKTFTADDVAYSIKRIADPKKSALAGGWPAFKSVEVIDPSTVAVRLSRPQSSMLLQIAQQNSQIFAAHLQAVDPKSTGFLVGTGAFKFKEYVSGISMILERNLGYYLPELPYLDGVQVSIIPDEAAMSAAIISGRLHIAEVAGISTVEGMKVMQQRNPSIRFMDQNLANGAQLQGKFAVGEPWSDTRVRRAVSLVIDREGALLSAFGDLKWGGGQKVVGFLPPGHAFALKEADIEQALGLNAPYENRIKEAKKLLAESGYPNGFTVNMLIRGPSYTQPVMEVVQDNLKKTLNIEMKIELLEIGAFTRKRASGDFQWTFDQVSRGYVSDPDEHYNTYVTGTPLNFGKFSNASVDNLYKQQSGETDYAARAMLVQKLERLLLTDLPGIPLSWNSFPIPVNASVRNWTPHTPGLWQNVRFDHVWLAR